MRLRASHWTKKNAYQRFWERVQKTDSCWLWKGLRTNYGYGRVVVSGRIWRVHRLAWTFENGSIPKSMMVCHKCNNRLCVRHSHLYLGNAQSNAHDAIRAGTFNDNHDQIGIPHPKKLTWRQVCWIREQRRCGAMIKDLALEHKVSEQNIKQIIYKRIWKCPPR